MRLRLIIGTLLLIQTILFVHMLFTLTSIDQAQVVAAGGSVTQVSVSPTTFWGGIHGRLLIDGVASDGSQTISVGGQSLAEHHLQFIDTDNECGRTELVASSAPIDITTLAPITPAAADAILGVSSSHAFSTTKMFTTLEQYDVAGNGLTLYSTTTGGRLRPYIQGIAQTGGNLVFVTKTVNNALAYDGSLADYQFLLPAGSWRITADDDSCIEINNFTQPIEPTITPRLEIAVPDRICVGQENTLYSVELTDRLFCKPHEVGLGWCKPVIADYSVTRLGDSQASGTTDDDGLFTFTPPTEGTYRVRVSTANQTVQKPLQASTCLAPTTNMVESGSQFITLPGTDVYLAELPDLQQPQFRKTPALVIAKTEFTIITLLSSLIITLSLFGTLVHYKDSAIPLLKFRIWLLEHFR